MRFLYFSRVAWTENIWCVIREKTPFLNSSSGRGLSETKSFVNWSFIIQNTLHCDSNDERRIHEIAESWIVSSYSYCSIFRRQNLWRDTLRRTHIANTLNRYVTSRVIRTLFVSIIHQNISSLPGITQTLSTSLRTGNSSTHISGRVLSILE